MSARSSRPSQHQNREARMQIDVFERDGGALAECPLWDEKCQHLYWIDVPGPMLHRRASDGSRTSWVLPSEIGCVVLRAGGGAVVGLRSGLHTLDLASGRVTFYVDDDRGTTTRYNDGKCDDRGRLWIGTLDDGAQARGRLYRVEADGSISAVRDGVICSNGINWSPDRRVMYWVDSRTHTIFAFDFDLDAGEIRNARPFFRDEHGMPDGLTVDSNGHIWCAWWDGWRVTRITPDSRVVQTLELPVARPTSVAFGGPRFETLFVTSARCELTPEECVRQPLAGAIFACEPGVTGTPAARFLG